MKIETSPEFTGEEEPQGFLIVGIGASAGGIQALKDFFEHVPAGSGMAYVVILHLSPDHDSKLAEVLQTVTATLVMQVLQNTKIEPNNIYVVPPNQHLIINDGYIAPSVNVQVEDRRAPIDIFFRNLADTYGQRAISVVLSGSGANGSMGLKRIKERGGVVYVQSPKEAEFNEMPRHAIATELVDEVLPVAEIPAKIIAYRDSIGSVHIPVEPDQRPEQQQQALRDIFTQLLIRTGHDFTNYKRPTLLRRIERRINLRNMPDLPSYSAFLQQHPDEANGLLKDLLISVTNFFRDQKVFETLERDVFPKIFEGRKAGSQVRIWVAGCATGEEAYSLAMLCAERVMEVVDAPTVQIFASDIDEAAISVAREGFYTLNDVADVSPERLRRFFNKSGSGYRIRREIREMILFATHNLLKDPPFSKLDLISCRNVMIYLNTTAQERALETFHFALRPQGFLFLGTSETVDGYSDLYSVFDRQHHIYQSREMVARNYPIPESVPAFYFSKNDPLQKQDEKDNPPPRMSFGELHQKLLEQYAPPSVVVNEEYEIVHMSENMGRYLEFAGGEPSQNLLKLVRPEIRLELRTALYQAVQNRTVVEARNIIFTLGGSVQSLTLEVRPVFNNSESAKGFILILFKPGGEVQPDEKPMVMAANEPVAKRLEEELIHLKTRLRSSAEQHEYQAEELKASNEELQAMNEELRSAAEELETSKEELQSINEELRTVNQELKVKIDETTLSSNNLQNLINSANVGTIFLDRSFSIRLFTPAVLDIFNLKSSDYGRPFTDITNKLQYDGLLSDAEVVLEKLLPVEREVTTIDGSTYLMRLLPYRTEDDKINGVVITFFDITQRKQSEEALRQSEEYLRLIIQSTTDYAIFTFDTDRRIVRWNSGAEKLIGYSEGEITGLPADVIFTPEDRQNNQPVKEVEKAEKEGRAENERWHMRKDGSCFWGSGSVSPLRDQKGNLLGFVKIMRDLTEQKKSEEAHRQSEEAYRIKLEEEVEQHTSDLKKAANLLQQAEDVAGMGSWEYELESGDFRWSQGMFKLFEVKPGTAISPEIYVEAATDDCKLLAKQLVNNMINGSGPFEESIRCNVKGAVKILRVKLELLKDETGRPQRVIGVDMDVTAAKQAETTVQEQAHLIQSINNALPDIVFVMDLEKNRVIYANRFFEEVLGYTPEQIAEMQNPFFDMMYVEDKPLVLKHLKSLQTLADDEVLEVDYRMKSASDGLHWFRDRNAIFRRDKKGVGLEKIGIAQDITERKKAEQELKESNNNLRYANENLQQFASIASHDLQEPLRKLKLFASVLNRFNEQLPEEASDLIGKIVLTSERMSQLITEVLQYSKMAYGEKEFVRTGLHDIFQKVLGDLDLMVSEAGATIEYGQPLPEIDAIPPQINQLFYNLLTNAVKFHKEDAAPVLKVSWRFLPADELKSFIHLQDDRTYLEITFSDSGIGFNQAYAEQIFQIFERLHPLDEYEGTGVGLALCKKILENHQGHIYAKSMEGAGASFYVILPIIQDGAMQNRGNGNQRARKR
jgi:two-component system CheB/CheR fusion protein